MNDKIKLTGDMVELFQEAKENLDSYAELGLDSYNYNCRIIIHTALSDFKKEWGGSISLLAVAIYRGIEFNLFSYHEAVCDIEKIEWRELRERIIVANIETRKDGPILSKDIFNLISTIEMRGVELAKQLVLLCWLLQSKNNVVIEEEDCYE